MTPADALALAARAIRRGSCSAHKVATEGCATCSEGEEAIAALTRLAEPREVYALYEDHGYDGSVVLAMYASKGEAERCMEALPDALRALEAACERFWEGEGTWEQRRERKLTDAEVDDRAKRMRAFIAPESELMASLVGDSYPREGCERSVVALPLRGAP